MTAGVVETASAVTLNGVQTPFEIDAEPGDAPFSAVLAPEEPPTDPNSVVTTDWAGTGDQAPPNLVVFNDDNFTPVEAETPDSEGDPATPVDPNAPIEVPAASVPDDITLDGIKADCAESDDNLFDLDPAQTVESHAVLSESRTTTGDLSDICQVLHAHQTARNETDGNNDQVLYVGATVLGSGEQIDAYTFWYELNQYPLLRVEDLDDDTRYRSVDDILIAIDYRGPHAGKLRGYTWDGTQWVGVNLVPELDTIVSIVDDAPFFEAAVNLTTAKLLQRRQLDNVCTTFRAARAMTSVIDQPDPVDGEEYQPLPLSQPDEAAGLDITAVHPLDAPLSNCDLATRALIGPPTPAPVPAGTSTITVRKSTTPAGGTGFAFTTTAGDPFTLNHGGSRSFPALAVGTYSFTESVAAGYALQSINCTGTAAGNVAVNLASATVSVSAAAGESVDCTFVNSRLGSLTIVKQTAPDGTAELFDFNASGAGTSDFRLADNGRRTFNGLSAGSYSVTESAAPGWFLSPVVCSGGSTARISRGINVSLAPGDNVTCTFTNIRLDIPRLTVEKVVENAYGGNATPDQFPLSVSGIGSVLNGVTVATQNGTSYTVTEDLAAIPGYVAFGPTICVNDATGAPVGNDGTFTAATNVNVTCTITNREVQPTLKVTKEVVNNNNGSRTADEFTLVVADGERTRVVALNAPALPAFSNVTYTVGEQNIPADYYQESITCRVGDTIVSTDGVVNPTSGQDVVCTVVNNDIGPRIKVDKTVDNRDGGLLTTADFTLEIVGASGAPLTPVFGETYEVNEGVQYTIGEADPSGLGYVQVGGVSCVDQNNLPVGTPVNEGADTQVSIGLTGFVTCTIANNDIAPLVTIVKDISLFNDGGELTPESFDLRLDGAPVTLIATGDGTTAASAPSPVLVGTHTVSEVLGGLLGYELASITCVDDQLATTVSTTGDFDIALAQAITCTVRNADIAPQVTLTKTPVATAGQVPLPASDFNLTYAGNNNTAGSLISGIPQALITGVTYTFGEDDPTALGYAFESIGCVDQDAAPIGGIVGNAIQITPVLGQQITCELVNNDIDPTLTLVKDVSGFNNGGNEAAADFPLLLNGEAQAQLDPPQPITLPVGTYTLTEGAVAGYTLVGITCTDTANNVVFGGAEATTVDVTLALGDNIRCTYVNDDIAPTLTVNKRIVNDNGGQVTAVGSFILQVDGNPVAPFAAAGNVVAGVVANLPVVIGETDPLPLGYFIESTVCSNGATGGINETVLLTLNEGENVTCTITNNDIEPQLIVNKLPINNDGGLAAATDFPLSINPLEPVSHGVATDVRADLSYAVNEDNAFIPGYLQTGTECIDLLDPAAGVLFSSTGPGALNVTVAQGQILECTITNDDIAPTITVVKDTSLFNDGGDKTPESFEILLDDALQTLTNVTLTSATGDVVTTVAGTHTIIETPVPGYPLNRIECADGATVIPVAADGTFTAAVGQNIVCTVYNDDVAPTITLDKVVVNTANGPLTPANVDVTIDEAPVAKLIARPVLANAPHTIGEVAIAPATLAGYTLESIECIDANAAPFPVDAGNQVTLAIGQDISCVLTNTDNDPTLTVVKDVDTLRDNNGNDTADTFDLLVDGVAQIQGEPLAIDLGVEYPLTEAPHAGYVLAGITCRNAVGDTVVQGEQSVLLSGFALGDAITCTYFNDDLPAQITVTKSVIQDDLGTAVAGDFGIELQATVDGVTTPVAGFTLSTPDLPVANAVNANIVYSVVEPDPSALGYRLVSLDCTNQLSEPLDPAGFTPNEGDIVTCTIVNDDIGPTLTIAKEYLTTNNGVPPEVSPFTFNVLGDAGSLTPVDGIYDLQAGITYTITENDPTPFGWTTFSIDCSVPATGEVLVDADPAAAVAVITPGLNQEIVCTVVNEDIAPTITFVKDFITLDGGIEPDRAIFDFTINGAGPYKHGQVVPLLSNTNYTIAEDTTTAAYLTSGFLFESLTCAENGITVDVGGDVTLSPGQNVVCTIVNDDIAPILTVSKDVSLFDNNGNPDVTRFPLFVTPTGGAPVLTDSGAAVPGIMANQEYTISESLVPGYTLEGIACADANGPVGTGGVVTLQLAQVVECVVTNQDQPATVTIDKGFPPGVIGLPALFEQYITLNGQPVTLGVPITIDQVENEMIVEETGVPEALGFELFEIGCVDDVTDLAVGANGVFTPESGQIIVCTVINQPTQRLLTVLKAFPDGVTADPTQFPLLADGAPIEHGVPKPVNVGEVIIVSEGDLTAAGVPQGFVQVPGIPCVDGNQDPLSTDGTADFTTAIQITCTITNAPLPATVSVTKQFADGVTPAGINPDTDFEYILNGTAVLNGSVTTVDVGGEVTLVEVIRDGLPVPFEPPTYSCTDAISGETLGADGIIPGDLVTPGRAIDCVITNQVVLTSLSAQVFATRGEAVDVAVSATDRNGVLGPISLALGEAPLVSPGSQWRLEIVLPPNYSIVPGGIDCTDATGSVNNGPDVNVTSGSIVCTILVDADVAQLTIDEVGLVGDPGDFTVNVFGSTWDHSGAAISIQPFETGAIEVVPAAGFVVESIVCDGGQDPSALNFGPGGVANCTITYAVDPGLIPEPAALPGEVPAPPADEPAAGQPAADQPPADQPPADVPPTDAPAGDQPPADAPPADVPPTDAPAGDQPPADAPPADVPPADAPAGDQPPADEPVITDPALTPPEEPTLPPVDPTEEPAPVPNATPPREEEVIVPVVEEGPPTQQNSDQPTDPGPAPTDQVEVPAEG